MAGILFETLMYGKEQYERRKAYEEEQQISWSVRYSNGIVPVLAVSMSLCSGCYSGIVPAVGAA
ncbi:hypothetical protein LIQ43_10575, partial [Bifidobacterium breve]|nr:hypothetical protein [Bifidobacterium breve]